MIKNKSTTICALVIMLLIVSSTAKADMTLVDSVDVETNVLYSPCTWQHPLNYSIPPATISSAEIEIEAFGVLGCWKYSVYFEGTYLGDLIGASNNWSTTYTTFLLDDYLTELMVGPVSIKIDVHPRGGGIEVRTSTLSVTYEPEKPWPYRPPAPFTLIVLPHKMADTIPGQKCVFLVKVIEEGSGYGRDEAVNISVMDLEMLSDAVVTVDPPALLPGQVGEITVIPGNGAEDPNSLRSVINEDVSRPVGPNVPVIDPNEPFEDKTLTITIMAERQGLIRTERVTVNVTQGQDEFAALASDYRDCFIPWLAERYTGLGITEETEWSGTIVRPNIVVVMYYLFFSEEWEMGLRWHVMIPPYDFAEIYLRRRDTNLSSTHAFKIYSLDAQDEPQVVALSQEGIWR